MGYTHYVTHTKPFTDDEWDKITSAANQIITTAIGRGIRIGDNSGDNPVDSAHNIMERPWIQDWGEEGPVIAFNGLREHSCETFIVYKNTPPLMPWQSEDRRGKDFCKTQREPYDAVVTACIIWIDSHYPGRLNPTSDGKPAQWAAGLTLAQASFPDDTTLRCPDLPDE